MLVGASSQRAESAQLPCLEVFVDESGDRGFGPKSSPYFAMVALIVPSESVRHMRAVAGGLTYMIGTDKPLHWKEHFKLKHEDRRRTAVTLLATIPEARVIYVIAPKEEIAASDALKSMNDRFYNWATRLLLERVSYCAAQWPGGPRVAVTRLGAVKNMDHEDTLRYLDRVRNAPQNGYDVPWSKLKWPPTWHGTCEYDGIQLADLYLGPLKCALDGNGHDLGCAELLLTCKNQLHRSRNGTVLGYGMKLISKNHGWLTERAWWDELGSLAP